MSVLCGICILQDSVQYLGCFRSRRFPIIQLLLLHPPIKARLCVVLRVGFVNDFALVVLHVVARNCFQYPSSRTLSIEYLT
jgi:hypothetical protein